MQAYGGIMSVTGVEGGEPVRVGTSIADMGSGMWAAMGILAALNRRHVTGEGCHVTTSLFETAIGWMCAHIGGYLSSGDLRRRMGSGVAEIVPHQAFETADGHVMVAAGNDNLFRTLAGVLARPELATDARFASNSKRVENRRTLIPLLQEIFHGKPTAEWLDAARRGRRAGGADPVGRPGGRCRADQGARYFAESARPRPDAGRPAARIRRQAATVSLFRAEARRAQRPSVPARMGRGKRSRKPPHERPEIRDAGDRSAGRACACRPLQPAGGAQRDVDAARARHARRLLAADRRHRRLLAA